MARTEFSGFNDGELRTIATRLGFDESAPLSQLSRFLSANPAKARQFMKVQNRAVKKMAVGGVVAAQTPTTFNYTYEQALTANANRAVKSPAEQAAINAALARGPNNTDTTPSAQSYGGGFSDPEMAGIQNIASGRLTSPGDFMPEDSRLQAQAIDGTDISQYIPQGAGQATATAPTATATTVGTTAQAATPITTSANTVDNIAQSADNLAGTLSQNQAAQGTVGDSSLLTSAVQDPATTAIAGQQAAQIQQAQQIQAPAARTIQQGELISGSAVDMTAANQVAAQTAQSAATATPTQQATVQGQLSSLMQDFEGGQTPSWAAGAMRRAQDVLGARGLGASTIAGQAVIQAAMESALPIAQADARTVASFEVKNLSNRQQSAMMAARQRAQFLQLDFNQEFQTRVANAARVADVANRNFTAEQQVALENARLAQTVDLQNLGARQAVVMAEIAQMSTLERANLNNRQAEAVQNAQAFLQMDMTNLSYEQQTAQINSQARIQSMFSDTAALNAARQFNATSQNQTDQFYANLGASVSQFNATQSNSMAQYNAGQTNAISQFNAQLKNQRQQFNAQNRLVVDQANAQWRRQIATADTAAVNFANQFNAEALLDASTTAYNDLWQYNRDLLEWAWTSSENDKSRMTEMAISEINAKTRTDLAKMAQDQSNSEAIGGFIFDIVKPGISDFVGGLFG